MTAPADGLVVGADGRARCWWPGEDPTYLAYHDEEWGRPTTDEQDVFELLALEGFQAGLAWITILRKRPAFRAAFADFDIDTVAAFTEADIERLLADAGIVRHRGKIEATIELARISQRLCADGSSLSEVVWAAAPAAHRRPTRIADIAASTTESTALSRTLKAHGARFVGPTIVYAFMQSAGIVDDHLTGCHRAGAT